MKRRSRRKEPRDRGYGTAAGEVKLSVRTGDAEDQFTEPDSPVAGRSGGEKVSKCSSDNDKVYLGVRVKMPVKDLLRNIRLAKGWDPNELQNMNRSTVKGEKKRVKTCKVTAMKKHPTKSLEELAIIVEVLEEDLKTSKAHHPSPLMTLPSACPFRSEWSPETNVTGYNSDESDEMIPSPQSVMSWSSGTAEYHQPQSPPGFMHSGYQPSCVDLHQGGIMGVDREKGDKSFGPPNHSCNLSNMDFFRSQLLREESQLRDISDAALLAIDERCRTILHRVVCEGRRALAFAIAKRMSFLNSLDLKDSDGMTPLLLAANHNQHLMVDDLIRLGASVNEKNKSGKSCLHLSAEKGYIRVLEVLKQTMMDGVYVDVEATDNSGMSVLQCASVALKATLNKLEVSVSPNHTRLHKLRKEQIMETLECLLQMASYSHTMGSWHMYL